MALRDLEGIRAFIARDDPAAAIAFCGKLLDHEEGLRVFPDRGGHWKERPGARFSMVGSYLIVYRVDQAAETVRILPFWYGARTPPSARYLTLPTTNRLRLEISCPARGEARRER